MAIPFFGARKILIASTFTSPEPKRPRISAASFTESNVAPADADLAPPAFEVLVRNRSRGDGAHLARAPEGRDLGLCACVGSCDPSACLNAALAIECSSENCALHASHGGRDGARGRCSNRQFALARTRGAADCGAEIFYTGREKGYGLRATRAFRRGELVLEYVGDVVREKALTTWRYAMSLKTGVAIDASKAGTIARFMNHSCRPCCCAERWVVNGEWRVGLFALDAIVIGTELTFSYGSLRGGFGDAGAPEECRCGERSCSGRIGITGRAVREAATAGVEVQHPWGRRPSSTEPPAASLRTRSHSLMRRNPELRACGFLAPTVSPETASPVAGWILGRALAVGRLAFAERLRVLLARHSAPGGALTP